MTLLYTFFIWLLLEDKIYSLAKMPFNKVGDYCKDPVSCATFGVQNNNFFLLSEVTS